MKYNITLSFLSIIILLSYPTLSIQTTTRTANAFYTSCTDALNQLPNLSTATSTRQAPLPDSFKCNTFDAAAANVSIVWSYYNSTNDPANCAPNTESSVLSYGVRVLFNGLATASGTVISGPYNGLPVTSVLTLATPNPTVCASAVGMVAQSGPIVLTIIGGPTCYGIFNYQFCPGLKN